MSLKSITEVEALANKSLNLYCNNLQAVTLDAGTIDLTTVNCDNLTCFNSGTFTNDLTTVGVTILRGNRIPLSTTSAGNILTNSDGAGNLTWTVPSPISKNGYTLLGFQEATTATQITGAIAYNYNFTSSSTFICNRIKIGIGTGVATRVTNFAIYSGSTLLGQGSASFGVVPFFYTATLTPEVGQSLLLTAGGEYWLSFSCSGVGGYWYNSTGYSSPSLAYTTPDNYYLGFPAIRTTAGATAETFRPCLVMYEA